jgi:hypothetical protein
MGIDLNELREKQSRMPGYKPQSNPVATPNLPVPNSFTPKEQDDIIRKWSSMVTRYLKSSTISFHHGKKETIERPGRTEQKLADSIRSRTRKDYGVIDRVSFIFERHGVFVHKGVGRGYKMESGMVVRNAKIEDPMTREPKWWEDDPRPRLPREWFNPILEQTLPELSNKLAEINADAVLSSSRMMIK